MLTQTMTILGQSGGGGTNWPAYGKIIIFGLFIAFSMISWLIKQLREQKAKKDAMRSRERAREEMLRTGRMTTPEPVMSQMPPETRAPQGPVSTEDAKRRLQEIAAKRRAELERLARSQGGSGGGAPAPMPAPPIRPQPVQQARPQPMKQSGRMTAPIDLAKQRAEADRAKAAHQKAVRKAAEAEKRKAAAAVKVRAKEADVRANEARQSDYAEQVAMESRRAAASVATASGVAPVQAGAPVAAITGRGMEAVDAALARTAGPAGAGGGGTAEWRRAFVLSELLRPPVTERE